MTDVHTLEPSFSGFLDKRSKYRFIGQIWSRRWCEIRGDDFIYHFRKPHYAWENKKEGSVSLREMKSVTLVNENEFVLESATGEKYHFRVSKLGESMDQEKHLLGNSHTSSWVAQLSELISSEQSATTSILKTESMRTSSICKTPFQLEENDTSGGGGGDDVEVTFDECYKEPAHFHSVDFNRQDVAPELLLKCLVFMGLEPYSILYDSGETEGATNGKSKSRCISERNAVLLQRFIQFITISAYLFIIIIKLLNPTFITCHKWSCNLPWVSQLFGYMVGLGLYLWMLKYITLATIIPTHRHRLDEWLNLFLSRLIVYWLVLAVLAIGISQLPDCKTDILEDRGDGPGNRGASGRLIALYVPLIMVFISPSFYFFVALYVSEALRLICIVEDFEYKVVAATNQKALWNDCITIYHKLRVEFDKVQSLMGYAVSAYAISSLLWVASNAFETFTSKYVAQKSFYTIELLGSIPPFLLVLYVMQSVNAAGGRIIKTVSIASSKSSSSNDDLHEVKLMLVVVNLPLQLTSLGRPISADDLFSYVVTAIVLQMYAFLQGFA